MPMTTQLAKTAPCPVPFRFMNPSLLIELRAVGA
jgi:hypothetical protein